MNYKVHRLEVKKETAKEQLEEFLNLLKGEIISILPYTSPIWLFMGATSKVDFLLIVEKAE